MGPLPHRNPNQHLIAGALMLNCQRPVGSAQWRTVELPVRGQQNCAVVAERTPVANHNLGGVLDPGGGRPDGARHSPRLRRRDKERGQQMSSSRVTG